MSIPSHAQFISAMNVIGEYIFWVSVHVLIVLAIWIVIVALMKRNKRGEYTRYQGLNKVRIYKHKKVA